MSKSTCELLSELAEARERERKARIHCVWCEGVGWTNDTSYDRTGIETKCVPCHGTGLPKDVVDQMIAVAFAGHVKPAPSTIEDWRPMGSAPKDGTLIDVRRAEDGLVYLKCKWHKDWQGREGFYYYEQSCDRALAADFGQTLDGWRLSK